MKTGFVSLVGAGCGSADLITVRGRERLQTCGAVVYDDLIDPELLGLIPAGAERYYMGKRGGRRGAEQAEISERLICLARRGLRVVRLKGGDPLVFGRGGEEAQALAAAGVLYEIVPGVSSAIAIPAAAGVPVTHRGVSRSFHVVTARTAEKANLEELERLAGLEGTLVFLMGLEQLPKIVQGLLRAGKSPNTPAAVLSGGNSPYWAEARGTLADIVERAVTVLPPAVIVIGPTAAMDLRAPLSRPLEGKRIGVVGTDVMAGKLRRELEELGAYVIRPIRLVLEEVSVELPAGLESPGWIVLTSANGVELFFRQLEREGRDIRSIAHRRFAVIGPGTGAAFAARGIRPDLCPEEHTSRGLGLALCAAAEPGEDVLLYRSAQGSRELPRLLESGGFEVRDLGVYRLRTDPLWKELPALDCLSFASAGGVERFWEQYGEIPSRIPCVCIGAVTAQKLRSRTDAPVWTAQETSAKSMAQAIQAALR